MLWKQVDGEPVFSGGPRKASLCQCHFNWDHRDALTNVSDEKCWRRAMQWDETLLIHLFIHLEPTTCQDHSQPWDTS